MTTLQLKDFIKIKKPEIIHHYKNPYATQLLAPPVSKKRGFQNSFRMQLEKVEIADHVIKRWNERVGPIATKESLQAFFELVFLRQQQRINRLSNKHCLIDQEIFAVYTVTGTTLKVITLFGRISLTPALANIKHMKHFKTRQNDIISLKPSLEVIQQQKFPSMPSDIIEYKGSQTKYLIEIYPSTRKELPFIILYQKHSSDTRFTETVIKQPNQLLLTNSTISLLAALGYGEFIRQNIKHFKRDRWNELVSIYSEKEINDLFKKINSHVS